MKLPAIKQLASMYDLAILAKAEADLCEGRQLEIEVPGDDEGEQLTHIMGAQHVLQKVAAGMDANTAVRDFTQRVRSCLN